MYKKLIETHKAEIKKQYEQAIRIEKKFNDNELINDVYDSSIIDMCIRFEAFTSDLYEELSGNEPRYNHPWANIRYVMDSYNIKMKEEYKVAHDMWDYYNTLKHINAKMHIEKLKIKEKYNITDSKSAAKKVFEALTTLLERLETIKL